MAIDPGRWTLKTQEAMQAAIDAARSASNPEITPEHLLAALLGQEGRVVLPVLEKVGVAPLVAAQPRPTRLGRSCPRPTAAPTPSWPGRYVTPSNGPTASGPELHDEYLSTEHLLLALADDVGVGREDLLDALKDVRGSHRVTSQNPEEPVPGPREVRPRPHRGGPRGQARPGHRPRRGDPPRHPGAVAPHQEQPGAHRRAGRRQDGHRRGPGPPHRRGRRARGPQEQARHLARPRLDGRGVEVPRRVRGAAEGRAQGDHRRRGRGHHLHRRAAHRSSAPARPRAPWTPAT